MPMDKEARQQYMDTLRERYFKGTKKEKGGILDEYCRNTGMERKYAIKKFRYKVKDKSQATRKKRKCFYDGAVMAVLVNVWKIFDYPCGARLETILAEETDRLRTFGEIRCSDEEARKLKQMKSATIVRQVNGYLKRSVSKRIEVVQEFLPTGNQARKQGTGGWKIEKKI